MLGGENGILAMGLMLAAVVAGLSSGVLGLGGGIVLVPALFISLRELGIPADTAVPVAVGTALAAMLPAALSILQNYAKKNVTEWAVFRHRAWLYALAGAMGAAAVAFLPVAAVITVIALAALACMAFLFLEKERWQLRREPLSGAPGWLVHGGIGLIGGLTGLGAAIFAGPYFRLCGITKEKSAAMAMAFEAVVTAAGAIVMIATGLYFVAILPGNSLGFINYAAFAVAAPVAFLVATFTAAFSSVTTHGALRKVFAVFILLSVCKMLYIATPLFLTL